MAHELGYKVLLEGVFAIHPQTSQKYNVTVTQGELSYALVQTANCKKETATNVIKIRDVLGCDCMRGKLTDENIVYFNVYIYPHCKKIASKCTVRKRKVVTMIFDHSSTFEENHKLVSLWQLVLSYLVRKVEIKKQDFQSLAPLPDRMLLVLVNPFSGSGKALHIFQKQVVPMFTEAGLRYTLTITEFGGHAREIVRTVKLEDWYGIVIVSGDGLIYEVINGLMDREDWVTAIKMPIGVIPGGSGNALASSLAFHSGEPYREKQILHSTFAVCKHTVVPMDLVQIETCTGKKMFSFLMVAWGIISDVDIESERFRNIGKTRFTLGAVIRIVDLRKYHGRLSYLPTDSTLRTRSDSFQEASMSRSDLLQREQIQRSVSLYDDSRLRSLDSDAREASAIQDSSSSVLPPLNAPVPANWTTIEDDFVFVCALYQTHMTEDSIGAPESKLNDGAIFLSFCRATVTRIRLLNMFTAMLEGKTLQDPSLLVVRVSAFRLEPMGGPGDSLGKIAVDGELVDSGPIQGVVLPSLARVMTL